uniref:Cytochrome c oxidase subunit 3 n=1 Tax=Dermanyssus gallinae TaxID=34641 RepID=A0A7U3PYA2_9ACAR|nr:cytochrome c oxidase subunit III [Dermanyssus gallinae]QPG86043.1 cytochrome c oxidase subunit 3 [Dermanyssus gallinae]
MSFKFHPFHIVSNSPWPLLSSLNISILMISILYMIKYKIMSMLMFMFLSMILNSYLWWRDVIRESTMIGDHTKSVMKSLKISMLLFILSEIFFFLSFFWSYFHNMLSPDMNIGMLWPPMNILSFNPYQIPLLNTIILISSGITITWTHHNIFIGNLKKMIYSMMITIMLGFIFLMFQLYEYNMAPFSMNDSIYGNIFFIATGFHGLHVLIGMIYLIVCMNRILNLQINANHHISFELAAWYWHFVDVVWLFLFLIIYWWNY